MFVELGTYRTKNDTYAHHTRLLKGMLVQVVQIIINEDIELCNVTIKLNVHTQFRVPIKTFIKYYEKVEDI